MAYRDTVQLGHPALKSENKLVEDFDSAKVKQVIQDLIDTMRQNDLIGMSAPQIAENYQVFVTEPRVTTYRSIDQADELRVYINPKIVNTSAEEIVLYEGCGSVANANIFGPVLRPREVTIEAFDQSGRKFTLHCDGLLARVIQHEFDHLKGIEFTQKIQDYKKLIAKEFYLANIRTSTEQVAGSKVNLKEVRYL